MNADTPPPTDDLTIPGDTATHRLHLMQMKINEINAFVERLQKRRATITEKIAKAKSNTNIARALTVEKQFARLVTKMENKLRGAEEDLNDVADELNKARALFFELSGAEIILEKEVTDGTETVATS
jgi:chorismate mutase